jgi:hypothetical protein
VLVLGGALFEIREIRENCADGEALETPRLLLLCVAVPRNETEELSRPCIKEWCVGRINDGTRLEVTITRRHNVSRLITMSAEYNEWRRLREDGRMPQEDSERCYRTRPSQTSNTLVISFSVLSCQYRASA